MASRKRKLYSIEDLHRLPQTPESWLIKDMLPMSGRTMLYGHGSSFKTCLAIDLAVAVATGGAFLRQFPVMRQGPVLLVTTESSIYRIRDRIFGHIRARELLSPELTYRKGIHPIANNEDCPLFLCHDEYVFGNMNDQADFAADMEGIKQAAGRYPVLVICDPLDSFITGDENRSSDTRPFRSFGNKIVKTYECQFVAIHHAAKEKEGEQPKLRGSSAWRGWIDTELLCMKKELAVGDFKIKYVDVTASKQRDGEEDKLFSAVPNFDNVRNTITYTLVRDGIDQDELLKAMHAKKILETLNIYGPLLLKDIQHYTQLSHKHVKAALQYLAEDGSALNDILMKRATSSDGSRQRTVCAWRAVNKTSHVELLSLLLRVQEQEANNDAYLVNVLLPPEECTVNATPKQPTGNVVPSYPN